MNTLLRRRLLARLVGLFDLVMLSAAYWAAIEASRGISAAGSWTAVIPSEVSSRGVLVYVVSLIAWNLIYRKCGLDQSHRLTRLWQDLKESLLAILLITAVTGMIGVLFGSPMANVAALLLFGLLSGVTLLVRRVTLRIFLGRVRRKGRNLRHLVIVGTNKRALEFARSLDLNPGVGFRVQGFVDDQWPCISDVAGAGYSIVSNLIEFPDYLRRVVVDEVVICLPMQSMYSATCRIASLCVEQGIMTRVFADYFPQSMAVTRTDHFEGRPVLMVSSRGIDGTAAVCKDFFDRVTALVLLLAFSPLMVITAFLIKVTSKGPVLFRQKRLGINKRVFAVLKFRTMIAEAELKLADLEPANEVSGPVFKMRNDPRITPVGRILRKLSIDELPQLFNVVTGDMSLVGPRPLPLRDYEGFSTNWHLRRFSVRPGISCLWQIQGRSSIPFERWMELDMQYIDNWSFWLDLKILAKTIPAVLRGQGAS